MAYQLFCFKVDERSTRISEHNPELIIAKQQCIAIVCAESDRKHE
jgi:hypothetical protein